MAGIVDVGEEFRAFCTWLGGERAGTVEALGKLANGFEGWLKIEWLMWLHTQRGLRLGPDPVDPYAEVGAEYPAKLDQRHGGMDKETKRVDLWIKDAGSPPRYHYVEIKAPFENQNADKLLDGAGDDLWYVTRLRKKYEQCASGSLVVLGVGFDDENWERALIRMLARAANKRTNADGMPLPNGNMTAHGMLGDRIRWCVWTEPA